MGLDIKNFINHTLHLSIFIEDTLLNLTLSSTVANENHLSSNIRDTPCTCVSGYRRSGIMPCHDKSVASRASWLQSPFVNLADDVSYRDFSRFWTIFWLLFGDYCLMASLVVLTTSISFQLTSHSQSNSSAQ